MLIGHILLLPFTLFDVIGGANAGWTYVVRVPFLNNVSLSDC